MCDSNCTGGNNEEDLEAIAAKEQKHFQYEVLSSATNDFHPSHKLGEGGFGPVYRVKISV
uniref:Protein kinase domain-containing protein n=1 Tax=Rhizophora mucronata TaxID=61149 RepID=A0A2P2KKY2_RHIMU